MAIKVEYEEGWRFGWGWEEVPASDRYIGLMFFWSRSQRSASPHLWSRVATVGWRRVTRF